MVELINRAAVISPDHQCPRMGSRLLFAGILFSPPAHKVFFGLLDPNSIGAFVLLRSLVSCVKNGLVK